MTTKITNLTAFDVVAPHTQARGTKPGHPAGTTTIASGETIEVTDAEAELFNAESGVFLIVPVPVAAPAPARKG